MKSTVLADNPHTAPLVIANRCAGRVAVKFHRSLVQAFLQDDSGQDLIEYALVAALVGLGAVASLKGLASNVGTVFTSVGTTLTGSL